MEKIVKRKRIIRKYEKIIQGSKPTINNLKAKRENEKV